MNYNKILIISLLLLNTIIAKGQNLYDDSLYFWKNQTTKLNEDYKQTIQNGKLFYDKYDTLKTVKGSGYKFLQRYEMFWNDRTMSSGSSIANLQHAFDAAYDYKTNYLQSNTSVNTKPWKLLGPYDNYNITQTANESTHNIGLVTSIWCDKDDPNYNTILAGTNASGLWKTTNKGQTWRNLTDSYGLSIGVEAIAVHPLNKNIIYIGTGFENGVIGSHYHMGILKSTDGGNNWVLTSVNSNSNGINPINCLVRKIIFDPIDNNIMYAIIGNKVIRSNNEFNTFEIIFNGDQHFTQNNNPYKPKEIMDIEIDRIVKNGVESSAVFISTDGYISWNQGAPTLYNAEIWKTLEARSTSVTWESLDYGAYQSVTPQFVPIIKMFKPDNLTNTDVLFFGYIQSSGNDISMLVRTADTKKINSELGLNFSEHFNYYFTTANYINWDYFTNEFESNPAACAQPYIRVYMGGVYLTSYNRQSAITKTRPHMDFRCIYPLAGNGGANDKLLIGTDGGISITENSGASFKSLNGPGLTISQFYGIGVFQDPVSDDEFIWGGVQDNGAWEYRNGIWKQTDCNDGGDYTFSEHYSNLGIMTKFCNTEIKYQKCINNNNSTLRDNSCSGDPIVLNLFGENQNEIYRVPKVKWSKSLTEKNIAYFAGKEIRKLTFIAPGQASYAGTNNELSISNYGKVTDFHNIPNANLGSNYIRTFDVSKSNPKVMYVSYNTQPNPPYMANTLFKFDNSSGTPVYSKLTDNLPAEAKSFIITTIVVSETNENELWIGCSGFGNGFRVYHSANGGQTWDNVSGGLPNFPVNEIELLPGSSSQELYLANDIGVFYHNNTMTNPYWMPFNDGLPGCIVTDIEFNTLKNKIYIATFGRGVWETSLSCQKESTPLVINGNTTFDKVKFIKSDIEVASGATLTILNKVRMCSSCGIKVNRGAHLVIDGGTLTSGCENERWQGIDVLGTSNMVQTSVLNDPNQGIVELKNGALIENAEDAIQLWNGSDWNTTGGIVVASNAAFKNNRRSVEFMDYQNKLPNNNVMDNLSSFTNCEFSYDDNYMATGNDILTHVTLYKVKGVKFYGCKFYNNRTDKQYSLSANKAIYSIDAGYYVCSLCDVAVAYGQNCPPENQKRSFFKGFNTAVEALGTNPNSFVKIDEADFEENLKSVRISALDNPWINRSNFLIGNSVIQNIPQNEFSSGIEITNSTGFRVEENTLSLSDMSNNKNNGIVIDQSGASQNQVYKNTIQSLNFGQLFSGLNRSTQDQYKGLQFLCNHHQGNLSNDVRINNQGIRMYQGKINPNTEMAAGNIFTDNICNIANGSDVSIFYSCFDQPDQKPLINQCPNQNNLFLTVLNTGNNCPSNFDAGLGFPLSAEHKTQLNTNYDQLETVYLNLLYTYNSMIDGGSTTQVLNKIQSTWPQEAWELRNELLSKSPYLSEEVLRETAIKNILPQAMLFEICIANPDGTRDQKFIDFLAYEIPNPLPQYMLDLIVANRETKSSRTLMESSLAEKGAEKDFIAGLLIANEMQNTESNRAIIRSWLSRRGNLDDFYARAESYIDENDFESANTALSQIPNFYTLDDAQQAEFNNFTSYLSLRSDMQSSGKSIMNLDSPYIEALRLIAENNTGRSSAIACNILCFGYQICYEDNYDTGEPKSFAYNKPKTTAKQVLNQAYNKVSVMPNPASVYTSFAWELPLLEGDATLTISDISSKIIMQHILKTKQGQWIWDTRNIRKGIYYYELKSAGKSIAHGKIVITE